MFHWELPQEFSEYDRTQRLSIHRERIEKEREVFDFFESIEHDCDYGELWERLDTVRDAIARVELRIEMLETPDFERARTERDVALEQYRQSMVRYAELVRLSMKSQKPQEKLWNELHLRQIRATVSTNKQAAESAENVVVALCVESGVDPRAYTRIHEVMS